MRPIDLLRYRREAIKKRLRVVNVLGSTTEGEQDRLMQELNEVRDQIGEHLRDMATVNLGYPGRHSDWR